MILSLGLVFYSVSVANNALTKVWAANPYQITNEEVKDNYLVYIKQKANQGQDGSPSDCNPGLENMKNKLGNYQQDQNKKSGNELDNKIINKLSDNINKKETILKDRFQKLRDRMEKAISEEEEKAPIPKEEQKKVDEKDVKTTEEHKSKTGDNCRDGNVLDGASNEADLKVLAECQDAAGDVMHTKKMNDGDYKFLVKLDDKYGFLVNDKNDEKTDGFLVVEVVPKDQDISKVDLPKEGDKVHIWGAWVTDKPKGWHEIHPTWEVTKQ